MRLTRFIKTRSRYLQWQNVENDSTMQGLLRFEGEMEKMSMEVLTILRQKKIHQIKLFLARTS